jgi:RND family efflux transporter MFP subunit
LVIVASVGKASINDRVTAIGDGEAQRSVTVVPLSAGVIEEVRISAGDVIEAGATIAVLDAEEQIIARDQAQLAVEIAEDKVTRYQSLVETRTVSQVQLTEARNELQRARLTLRDEQLALDRRSITAPIGGTVGILPVEAGDYVTQQTEIATIDDRSKILLDFWVPERFASQVQIGQTIEANAIAIPGVPFGGEVSAIASRVDRDSRTFQIRALLDNEGDRLRPGMSFRVTLYFDGDPFPAVDPLAVQWSSSGPFLWKVNEGKAEKVQVNIIQRNSDYVLVSGEIEAGEDVVIEGVQSLRPGSALNIARRSEAPGTTGS